MSFAGRGWNPTKEEQHIWKVLIPFCSSTCGCSIDAKDTCNEASANEFYPLDNVSVKPVGVWYFSCVWCANILKAIYIYDLTVSGTAKPNKDNLAAPAPILLLKRKAQYNNAVHERDWTLNELPFWVISRRKYFFLPPIVTMKNVLCSCFFQSKKVHRMARGLQAQQSQAKAQEKAAKLKKMQVLSLFFCFEGELQWTTTQGNSKHDNAKTAAAGLKFSCAVCRSALT